MINFISQPFLPLSKMPIKNSGWATTIDDKRVCRTCEKSRMANPNDCSSSEHHDYYQKHMDSLQRFQANNPSKQRSYDQKYREKTVTTRLLEEIRSELLEYSKFDVSSREGLQEYLSHIKEGPPADPQIDSMLIKEDMLVPDSSKFRLVFCENELDNKTWVYIRNQTSRLPYQKAPGRNIRILVYYGGKILGIIALSSPVLRLGPRDDFLKLENKQGKGLKLLSVVDMSACVGVQPWASRHNGGKLLAILATSKEVADYYETKYQSHGAKNLKSVEVKEKVPLKWICTTSIYGKSIQYDRIYKFLGYSKGFGTLHIANSTYDKMMKWVRMTHNDDSRFSNKWGDGANSKMRRITRFLRLSGLSKENFSLVHGQRRGVYIHEVQNKTSQELFDWWYGRWCRPRLDKMSSANA